MGYLTNINWDRQVSEKGTVGTNLDVTPVASEMKLFEMIITAPLATDGATIIVYKDTAAAGSIIFDGHMQNRNADGSILFPLGEQVSTKYIVAVSGGSGDLYVSAKYR